jgi:hypothetical protein
MELALGSGRGCRLLPGPGAAPVARWFAFGHDVLPGGGTGVPLRCSCSR